MIEVQFGSNCPSCGAALGDDYGMVTCGSCGSQLFVAMGTDASGSSIAGGADAPAAGFLEPLQPAHNSQPLENFDFAIAPQNAVELEPPHGGLAPAPFDPADPLEINAFANPPENRSSNEGLGEMELGREGLIAFDVEISGIDSSELRAEVLESLSDPRLQLNASQLKTEIRGGQLQLRTLNPVKASVIVQKLLGSGLQVSWSSRLITSTAAGLAILLGFAVVGQWILPTAAHAQTAATLTCKWSEHETKMQALQTKMKSLQDEIANLIESKKKASNPDAIQMITTQIQFKYDDLRKAVTDYESERTHSRFYHPERALSSERNYPSTPLMTLDEIENSFGVDGRLDRLKAQLRVTYPDPKLNPKSQSKEGETDRGPASSNVEPSTTVLDELKGLKLSK